MFDAAAEAQDGSINALARQLSRDLGCIAMSVTNHDDSVLYFQVFEAGELRDRYGRTTFGQSCLLAPRFVEAGTLFVQANWPKVEGRAGVTPSPRYELARAVP